MHTWENLVLYLFSWVDSSGKTNNQYRFEIRVNTYTLLTMYHKHNMLNVHKSLWSNSCNFTGEKQKWTNKQKKWKPESQGVELPC